MKIGFVLFENYHQKRDIGSSRIRGHWIMNYLEDAEPFVQGKDYDVVVYQKVYWKEHARQFKGIKILDVCDPDWLTGGFEVIEIFNNVHAITVSSKKLEKQVKKMTDTPVYFIPDRIDFNTLLAPKVHKGKAKKVCWFGYSDNIEVLDPVYMKLKQMNLTLKIISDATINTAECSVENVKYDSETANKEIQECDFVIMPEMLIGRHVFKSNNKTIQSWALGMPVAKTPEDLERFMKPEERTKEAEKRIKEVYANYDVEKSAKALEDIINGLQDLPKGS